MCAREESRPMEAVARFFLKPVQTFFPTAITIPTATLAKAMVNAAVSPPSELKSELLDNKAIHQLSGDLKRKK